MTHRLVTVGADEYDFAPEDATLVGRRWFALATAQLVDEILEAPIRAPFAVHAETKGIGVKVGTDGTFALVAQPQVRFPATLGPRPRVRVRVMAQGYATRTFDFTIPFDNRTIVAPVPAAGNSVVTLSSTAGLAVNQMLVLGSALGQEFARLRLLGPGPNQVTLAEPLRFAHAVAETVMPATQAPTVISLHRQPVSFGGRVVRINPGGAPPSAVANATVTLADFWRTQRAVRNRPIVAAVPVGDMTGPAPQRFVVALAQGTLATRAAGGTAGRVTFPAVSPDEKELLLAANPGDTAVRLSNYRNLIATSLLRIGSGDAQRSEIHTVKAILPLGAVTDPASIQLDHPLTASHAPGTRVDRLQLPAGPLPLPLNVLDTVENGDRTVFMDALPAAPVSGLCMANAGIANEFHDCDFYSATSDASGNFRLPPLHRLAQVRLDVNDGATTTSFYVDPDYAENEQWLDLAIP